VNDLAVQHEDVALAVGEQDGATGTTTAWVHLADDGAAP
jgi:hypothetical protein